MKGFIVYNSYTNEKLFVLSHFSYAKEYARENRMNLTVKSIRTGKWASIYCNSSLTIPKVSAWYESEYLNKRMEG